MKLAIMFGVVLSISACAVDQDGAGSDETTAVEQEGGPVNTCYRTYQCGGMGTEYIGQVPGRPSFFDAQQSCQLVECNGHRCTNTQFWCEPN